MRCLHYPVGQYLRIFEIRIAVGAYLAASVMSGVRRVIMYFILRVVGVQRFFFRIAQYDHTAAFVRDMLRCRVRSDIVVNRFAARVGYRCRTIGFASASPFEIDDIRFADYDIRFRARAHFFVIILANVFYISPSLDYGVGEVSALVNYRISVVPEHFIHQSPFFLYGFHLSAIRVCFESQLTLVVCAVLQCVLQINLPFVGLGIHRLRFILFHVRDKPDHRECDCRRACYY